MNSLISKKKLKFCTGFRTVIRTTFLMLMNALPQHQQLAEHICFLQYILFLNMILMSEKMTSQTIHKNYYR